MGNRLLDYGITNYQNSILDNPTTNAAFLTQYGQRNPTGWAPTTYGGTKSIGGFVPRAATTQQPTYFLPGGGRATFTPTVNPESPRDFLGRAYFDANPSLLGGVLSQQSPGLTQFQELANQIAAQARAKDSGNFFTKFLQNVGTGVSLATGMNGLVAGLGALSGQGLLGAVKAGYGGATGLGKSVVSSFLPRAVPTLFNPITSAASKLNTFGGLVNRAQGRDNRRIMF